MIPRGVPTEGKAFRGVDGGLIGGAALKPDQFVDIINAANQED